MPNSEGMPITCEYGIVTPYQISWSGGVERGEEGGEEREVEGGGKRGRGKREWKRGRGEERGGKRVEKGEGRGRRG